MIKSFGREILAVLKEQMQVGYPSSNSISTKANTLLALKDKLKLSFIEDILVISVEEFLNSPQNVFENIRIKYKGSKIVVRSSCSNEDCLQKSNAGHYESILNVDSQNYHDVFHALQMVKESYEKDMDDIKLEQILVQTQTENVIKSGVIFTL